MSFTTSIFLFIFFPIVTVLYYLTDLFENKGILSKPLKKIHASELLLTLFSFVFFAWACFDNALFLLLYIAAIYIAGRIIYHSVQKSYKLKSAVFAGISFAVLLAILIYCKYTQPFLDAFNNIFGGNSVKLKIITPIGISFISFSAISYLADIKTGKEKPGSLLDCALYILFFPKVISGPIVLWRDFKTQLSSRRVTLDRTTHGIGLIMLGFAKKVILADSFGAQILAISSRNFDVPTAWLSAVLYMLQIYFDFSGYSDIAIGISEMYGYEFSQNFDYPYLSLSITEFWRRWHISLGRWFREYVYIPLGGNRKGKIRTLVNLGAVFVLTGIWHGAGLNYLIWGGINGFFVIAERVLRENKLIKKIPAFIKWLYATGVTFICWQIFRSENLEDLRHLFARMAGLGYDENITHTWYYYFDRTTVCFVIAGILLATLPGLAKISEYRNRLSATKTGYAVKQVLLILLFVISVIFMINSTYSPFIYFRY